MCVPFVWILVLFASGVACARMVEVSQWILLPATVTAILALRCSTFRLAAALQLLWILLIAAVLTQTIERQYNRNELRIRVSSHEKEVFLVEGTVTRTPEISDQYFVIQVEVDSISGSVCRGAARLTVSGDLTRDLIRGDRIRFFASLRLPRNFKTEGAFNYEQYLRTQNIHVLGTIKNERLIHKIMNGDSVRSYFSRIRLKWIRNTIQTYSTSHAGILRALWLDDRGGLKQTQERILIDAGIFHVIAISGFHISILLLLLFLIFKRLVSFRFAIAAACCFLLAYFLILEGRSSVTRSFLSFLIIAFAIWRYEQIRLANWISLTALTQLVLNPQELYDAGFQLTYLSTCAILFLVVPISKRFVSFPKHYRYPLNFVLTGLIVQIVLIPYQVYVFHRVPLYTFFANIVAVPVSSILIAVSGVLMPAPIIAKFLRLPVEGALAAFMQSASLTADYGVRILPSPPIWCIFAFYICLFFAVAVQRCRWKGVYVIAASILWIFIFIPRPLPARGSFQIHFLDVGQGDSILIEYPDRTFDLVDGGGFFNSDALDTGQAILIPYLCRQGITRLERVFLTHAHADHMNGLISLLRYISVGELYVTRQPVGERNYQYFVRNINHRPVSVARGRTFTQAGVQVSVLAPDDSNKTNRVRNDDSLVLLLEYRGTRILLTGDIELDGEDALVRLIDRPVDYIKVPHHGSKTSSSAMLLDAIKPRGAFISVGSLNWFGHPDPTVLARYRERHVLVYRTDLHGTIRLEIGNDAPRVIIPD